MQDYVFYSHEKGADVPPDHWCIGPLVERGMGYTDVGFVFCRMA